MEHNYLVAFLITALAGMATVLGGGLTFFIKKDNLHALSVGLGFSAGVMIFIALYAIMQESKDFYRFLFLKWLNWLRFYRFSQELQ